MVLGEIQHADLTSGTFAEKKAANGEEKSGTDRHRARFRH